MPRPGHPSTSIPPMVFAGERLRAPPGLDGAEREVFVDLIASSRADHFQPCDLPLICAYVRAAVIERETSEAIRKAPLLASASLLKANEMAILTLYKLSMRLRTSPQGRQAHKSKRSNTDSERLSYYERAAIMRGSNAKS